MARSLYDYTERMTRPVRSRPKLASMALSDEEKNEYLTPIAMPDRPEYPCELRICLTDATIQRLGLGGDCQVGDLLDLRAFARVTSKSESTQEDGTTRCRLELQIESMACENEMTEDDNG